MAGEDAPTPDFAIIYKLWKKYINTQIFGRKKCSKFFLTPPYYWLEDKYMIARYKKKGDFDKGDLKLDISKPIVLLDSDAISIGAGTWFPIPIPVTTSFPELTNVAAVDTSQNSIFKYDINWHEKLPFCTAAAACWKREVIPHLPSNTTLLRKEIL